MSINNLPSNYQNKSTSAHKNNSNKLNLSSINQAAALVANIKDKEIKIKYSTIEDMSKGLSEIAEMFGSTNEKESYEEMVEEDVLEGLKIAIERRRERSKRG